MKDILFHTATTTYATQFYESYIPNNKRNKHNPNNQNNDINVGFITNTKFVLLQLRQHTFWSIHIEKNSNLTNFVHFIHHQFVRFIDPEKPVRGLMNNFVHFIHPYMNSLPEIHFFRSSYQRCSVKKGVFRNFAKFTGKHICQRLIFL